MPELPEVERFKRYLDATALHQEVESVELRDAKRIVSVSARKLRDQVQGKSFVSTARHGKYLLVHLESPPLLVLHFGMTGSLDYSREDDERPEHTRVVFHFAQGHKLAYVCPRKLGRITLTDDRQTFLAKRRLGPDALDRRLMFRVFSDRLSGRRGAIKSAIMNQAILAGVGNLYADEILFQARIAPGRRVDNLDEESVRTVHRTMRRVLRTSIRHNAEFSQLPRSYLLRRREPDGRCPRCGSQLKQVRISGRGTHFCPNCQE